MRNKALAADDHRYEAKPRPAHNIDILRCCVTFEDVASMRKGIEGLVALARKGCGGVGAACHRLKSHKRGGGVYTASSPSSLPS